MRSIAIVQTDHAARYMGQLVKHFAHKLPTALEADGFVFTSPTVDGAIAEALA